MGGNVADSDIDGHDTVEQSGRMAGQQGEAVGDGSCWAGDEQRGPEGAIRVAIPVAGTARRQGE
jgi:hypothetical protein